MPRKKAPKVNRRARGSGAVFWDKRRGCWLARVPVGRKPDGRVRYREVRAGTQAEVLALARAVEPPTADTTLADWCDRWLPAHHCRETTRDIYETCLRLRIKPDLGHRALRDLTAFDVEEAVAKWRTRVAVGTVENTLKTLSVALQAAVRADLLARNVARAAPRPRKAKPKLDLFSPEELRAVVAAGLTRPNWRCFAVCAATGARIGEVLALPAGAYDPDTGELSISRTRTRRHGFGPPKSKHSTRTITVPAAARPALEAGVPHSHYPNAHVRWKKLLASLGLRYRPIHSLRHSVASHSIAAGAPLANVARDLGDSVAVVVRTYLHATPGAGVYEAMEGLLNGAEVAREVKKPPESPRKKGKSRRGS